MSESTQATDDESEQKATYIRIEGLEPADFADVDTSHDETALHDLADRVFADLRRDYPDLYDQHGGVVPVFRPEHDPRVLETTTVYAHRDETVDDGVSDFVFCSFGDELEQVDAPGMYATVTEYVETRLMKRFDDDRDRLDDLLPTESEREEQGDDPVRVGTLFYTNDRVVRVDFDSSFADE